MGSSSASHTMSLVKLGSRPLPLAAPHPEEPSRSEGVSKGSAAVEVTLALLARGSRRAASGRASHHEGGCLLLHRRLRGKPRAAHAHASARVLPELLARV